MPNDLRDAVASAPCPCTLAQQDESCSVGYPSLLCCVCDGKGTVDADHEFYPTAAALSAMIGEFSEDRILSALTPTAPSVQEAARVLLDHLLNLEESDAWEAAQDAIDRPMSDGSDVVIAALRAIAGEEK